MKPSLLPCLSAVALMIVANAAAEEARDNAVFPFQKGRYWLYDGTVTFVQDGEVTEQKITGWKSEVVDVFAGKDFQAALLKGHPGDLAWFEPGKQRREVIVVLTAKGEYYEIAGVEQTAEKFAAIRSTGKLAADLLEAGEMIFRYPLKTGDRFGDPEITKQGERYCWVVMNCEDQKPDPPIKGVPADKQLRTFTLSYRSTPDHTYLKFAAGVGITSYEYVHHGTKGDCEVTLVETGTKGPQNTTENRK